MQKDSGDSSNIILDTYDKVKDIWFLVFKASLQQGLKTAKVSTAKVSTLFKSVDLEKVNNYRHI